MALKRVDDLPKKKRLLGNSEENVALNVLSSGFSSNKVERVGELYKRMVEKGGGEFVEKFLEKGGFEELIHQISLTHSKLRNKKVGEHKEGFLLALYLLRSVRCLMRKERGLSLLVESGHAIRKLCLCLEFEEEDSLQLITLDILMILSVMNNSQVIEGLFYLQRVRKSDSIFAIILKIINKCVSQEGKETLLESCLTFLNALINTPNDALYRILLRKKLEEKGFTFAYRDELLQVFNDLPVIITQVEIFNRHAMIDQQIVEKKYSLSSSSQIISSSTLTIAEIVVKRRGS